MKYTGAFFGSILFFMFFTSSTITNNEKCYLIRTDFHEDIEVKTLVEKRFKSLENVKNAGLNIVYSNELAVKCACEIIIDFQKLSLKDEEYIKNKHFSKVVRGEQIQSDDGAVFYDETVNGYVHQQIKERKLTWDIQIKSNSETEACGKIHTSFTERISSKSTKNTLSGDERAISKKYKTALGNPLRDRREMLLEAVDNIYEKVVAQLNKSD